MRLNPLNQVLVSYTVFVVGSLSVENCLNPLNQVLVSY